MMNARHLEHRLRIEPLGATEVDWMLLETAFWSRQVSEPPDWCSTLLVSCSTRSVIGRELAITANHEHGMTCAYGRTDLSSAGHWLVRTGVRNSYIEHAVVFVDDSSRIEADTLVRSLKSNGVERVFVVCGDATLRESVTQADGFVVGSVATDLTTAAMLTDIVHDAVQAPAKMKPVDAEDLFACVGSARSPGVLAEGIWRRMPFGFEFMSPADQASFEDAVAVFVHPVLGRYSISELGLLTNDVVGRAKRPDVAFVLSWPDHGFSVAWNSPRAALVRMLCRLRQP
jgi:hypothetical protein